MNEFAQEMAPALGIPVVEAPTVQEAVVGADLIVCDLTGVGTQDAAMAGVVWELLESGAGLANGPPWETNPEESPNP